MHSPDLSQDNIAKIRALFPNCVTEAKNELGDLKQAIDFDLLKQELSDSIVEGPQERYHLNWPGKREALLTANAPIAKTLRPCREESVNFDTTENLFIEGDNLEALKLLQETYLGKVKMIFIDPPYNTGMDFIYNDDFTATNEEFLNKSNQVDEYQNKLVSNIDSNGRFHSDWLSMMYSRLKVSAKLLQDDGLIFIQIDDNELTNLKKLCDEVFGESNLISLVTVKMSHLSGVKMSHVDKKIPKIKEFILIYAKHKSNVCLTPIYEIASWDDSLERYTQFILNKELPFESWSAISARQAANQEGIDYTNDKAREKFLLNNSERIFRTARNKSLKKTGIKGVFSQVITATGLKKYVYNDEEVLFASDKMKVIDGKLTPVNILGDIWTDIGINNLHNEGGVDFRNGKKPIKLLTRLLEVANVTESEVVLDFFAGSSSTAHACMLYNQKKQFNVNFVMVQIPEVCSEKSEARIQGFDNIANLSKERIRRSGKELSNKLSEDMYTLDFGFRVLKIDSSNMTDVFYRPDQIIQTDMFAQIENIKEDRTDEDLLFQVLLDWGVGLTLPIAKQQIQSKDVYFVNSDEDNECADLIACFAENISNELVKFLAEKQPLRVVFRDDGFANDSVKINVEQIFKQISPITDIKSI